MKALATIPKGKVEYQEAVGSGQKRKEKETKGRGGKGAKATRRDAKKSKRKTLRPVRLPCLPTQRRVQVKSVRQAGVSE